MTWWPIDWPECCAGAVVVGVVGELLRRLRLPMRSCCAGDVRCGGTAVKLEATTMFSGDGGED